jgi:hypothetical protein
MARNTVLLSQIYAECRYAECRYAECRGTIKKMSRAVFKTLHFLRNIRLER